MWKKIEFAIVLLLLAVLIMMSNHLEEMVSSGRVTGRNPCIVLDSGHGGEDPGKIGVNQAKEKDVNLKIAKKTKERLEKKGWKVVMTREKDVMLGDPAAGNKKIHDMKARVERINKTMPQAAVNPPGADIHFQTLMIKLARIVEIQHGCVRIHIRIFEHKHAHLTHPRPTEVCKAHAELRIPECHLFKFQRM